MDQGLDYGVVGGVHVGVEGEGALPVAIVGGVAVRSDDPVLPTEVAEADIQCPLLTAAPSVMSSVKVAINVVIFKVLLQSRKLFLSMPGRRLGFLFLF